MSALDLDQRVRDEPGVLLRYWREVRSVSQLDLPLDAGISQRQISFIESGRSVPGRQTLLNIAQSLEVPPRERDVLRLSAGCGPMYSEAAWNAEEMSLVTGAVRRVLQQHEPFAAIVMDRYWKMLITNRAAPGFFNCFVDMAAHTGPRNLLHLIFEPQGLRPRMANWETLARGLIRRVHRESAGHVGDLRTRQFLDALLSYPGVRSEWRSRGMARSASMVPMVPIGFINDGAGLNYFSIITTGGMPLTVAAQELRIECVFPADDQTEARHIALLDLTRK